MAKAAKKVTRKAKPPKIQLIVRESTSETYLGAHYIEGENCDRIEYDSTRLWFKIHFEQHTETFIGIPYSVIEPRK